MYFTRIPVQILQRPTITLSERLKSLSTPLLHNLRQINFHGTFDVQVIKVKWYLDLDNWEDEIPVRQGKSMTYIFQFVNS